MLEAKRIRFALLDGRPNFLAFRGVSIQSRSECILLGSRGVREFSLPEAMHGLNILDANNFACLLGKEAKLVGLLGLDASSRNHFINLQALKVDARDCLLQGTNLMIRKADLGVSMAEFTRVPFDTRGIDRGASQSVLVESPASPHWFVDCVGGGEFLAVSQFDIMKGTSANLISKVVWESDSREFKSSQGGYVFGVVESEAEDDLLRFEFTEAVPGSSNGLGRESYSFVGGALRENSLSLSRADPESPHPPEGWVPVPGLMPCGKHILQLGVTNGKLHWRDIHGRLTGFLSVPVLVRDTDEETPAVFDVGIRSTWGVSIVGRRAYVLVQPDSIFEIVPAESP